MTNLRHLVLTLLLALLCCQFSYAYDFEVNGIYYNILSESNLTCEVTTEEDINIIIEKMQDEDDEDDDWWPKQCYKGIVTIPSTVSYNGKVYTVNAIGDYAFLGQLELSGLNIPNTITSIGNWAIGCCYDLIAVTIPNSVTSIGMLAFCGCINLSNISIPDYVNYIGSGAFNGCEKLQSIKLPKYITQILEETFCGCSSLESIEIPQSVKFIGELAFCYCCNLESVICYAEEPPVLDEYVFWNIHKEAVLYVPVVSNYENSDWASYFRSIEEASGGGFSTTNLEIRLPEDYIDGRYNNMSLEIADCNSKNKYKYTTSDNGFYKIHGLSQSTKYNISLKNYYGDLLGEISGVELIEENTIVSFESLRQPKTININVLTPEGKDKTKDVSVSWYKTSGEQISQGTTIAGVLEGNEIVYSVALSNELLAEYSSPAKQTYKIKEKGNDIQVQLEELNKVLFTGKICDENGKSLPFAVLTISPVINGKYGNSVTATTDVNGHYETELYNLPVKVTISSNGYISQTVELPSAADGLGNIILERISGFSINITTDYSDQMNVAYRVLKSGQELEGCIYQGSSVILPSSEETGDELTLVAYSKNNKFKEVSKPVVLNGKNTYVEIPIIEYGHLDVKCEGDGYGSIAILYNNVGELVSKASFSESVASFENVPDGTYSVVAMKKSGSFSSILKLSTLNDVGMRQGSDYLMATSDIISGSLSEVLIGKIPEFEGSNSVFTTSKGTYFMATKTSATVGNYVSFKINVELDKNFKFDYEDANLVVDIPNSCEFVENSVRTGSSYVYRLDGNRLYIPLKNIEDLAMFCLIPWEDGDIKPTAFVQIWVNGEETLLPIGSAYFTAKKFNLNTIDKTAKKTITVNGVCLPNSEVLVYDNDVLVGKTNSTANGKWETTVTFVKPYSHSMHEIYGEVLTSDGKRLLTETKLVDYSENNIDVERISMLYNGQSIEFIPTQGETNIGYYSYNPIIPDFVFTVDFTDNNPSVLSMVYFKILASDGTVRTLEAKYNEATNNWVASTKYADTQKLPVNVKVEYELTERMLQYDAEMEKDLDEYYNLDLHKIVTIYNNGEFEIISDSNDEVYFSIIPSGETQKEYFRITALDYEITNQEMDNHYTMVVNDTTNCCFQDTIINNEYRLTIVNHLYKYAFLLSYYSDKPNGQLKNTRISNIALSAFGVFTNWLEKNLWLDIVKEWGRKHESNKTTYLNLYNELPRLLNARCNDGSLKIKDKNKYNELNYQLKLLVGDAEKFFTEFDYNYSMLEIVYKRRFLGQALTSITLSSFFGRVGKLAEGSFAASYPNLHNTFYTVYNGINDVNFEVLSYGLDALLNGTSGASLLQAFTDWDDSNNQKLKDQCEKIVFQIKASYSNCEKDDDDVFGGEEEEKNGHSDNKGFPTPPITPSIDPSGYVYEAVPSNRLQGVTATVYYMQQTEDMYGDITEEPVVWNADEFGQQNPLTTDEQGMYAWDVPQGMWQVKFEKEGYETTYSEWLPVPPPQLDVNIPMVQVKQPEVKNVHAYTDAITIEFDKFMLPETLTEEKIKITQNGKDIEGEVTLINIESDGNGNSYCSKIEFLPNTNLAVGETTVFVSSQVKSYANLQMGNDFHNTVKVESKVQDINVEDVEVFSGSSVKIVASVLPASAGEGKKFVLEEINPYIAAIDHSSIVMNNNGTITFDVDGLIPGKAVVRLSLEGYDFHKDVTITVMEMNKVATPTASVPSGSEIAKGTEVYLYCSTEGATIYYTIDGSCPCDLVTAKVYDGTPVIINESLTLKTMAMKEGMLDSNVAELKYKVTDDDAIEEIYVYDELKIYPLPMRDVVNITVGGKEITRVSINTLNGTQVCYFDKAANIQSLNVQKLLPGIYVINVSTAEGKTFHKKVIKF